MDGPRSCSTDVMRRACGKGDTIKRLLNASRAHFARTRRVEHSFLDAPDPGGTCSEKVLEYGETERCRGEGEEVGDRPEQVLETGKSQYEVGIGQTSLFARLLFSAAQFTCSRRENRTSNFARGRCARRWRGPASMSAWPTAAGTARPSSGSSCPAPP